METRGCDPCHCVVISWNYCCSTFAIINDSNFTKMITLDEEFLSDQLLSIDITNVDSTVTRRNKVHLIWIIILLKNNFFWLRKASGQFRNNRRNQQLTLSKWHFNLYFGLSSYLIAKFLNLNILQWLGKPSHSLRIFLFYFNFSLWMTNYLCYHKITLEFCCENLVLYLQFQTWSYLFKEFVKFFLLTLCANGLLEEFSHFFCCLIIKLNVLHHSVCLI